MTAVEKAENNAPNCNKPKLNDNPFADMRDGDTASMVAHFTDESTDEDTLAKYRFALRLSPTSSKNPLLFWRENASEFLLMSATSTANLLYLSKFYSV
jgi:hypothetical protein